MCKFNPKNNSRKIDPCMENMSFVLQERFDVPIAACCCGHGKYPMTIVLQDQFGAFELFTGVEVPRNKRFYKKDKQGYYYIPETLKASNKSEDKE